MRRPLITAEDVRSAAHPTIPEGALLTPLARDLLRRQGVRPERAAPSRAPAARLVIANWKSHKTFAEARAWAERFRAALDGRPSSVQPVVCPPFTALAPLGEALAGAADLGAQDLSPHDEGAHTGEVAARHLVDAGCRFAVVGHSERRAAGETDGLVRAKLRTALRASLQPVLCIGETAAERDAARTEVVVSDQLRSAFDGLAPSEAARVVVAYEPRWAIGRGVTPTADEVAAVLHRIRVGLERLAGEGPGRRVSVLYGGSVHERNAGALLHLPGCSGALVGGASLDADRFAAILKAA